MDDYFIIINLLPFYNKWSISIEKKVGLVSM
jgi:hypothetical protein